MPLLLIVVVFVFIAAVGGGGESSDPVPDNNVALGQPLTVGEVVWQATGAREAEQLSAEFMPTKSGNFVIVDFQVTNNGNETINVDESYLTLQDSQGRTNEVDSEGVEYIPNNRWLFFEDVNPGVTQRGQVIFTVAPNSSGFTLEATDGMFSSETGTIDLGF